MGLGRVGQRPIFRGGCLVGRLDALVEEVADEMGAWVRVVARPTRRAVGAVDPERVALQLVLLYDGATVAARMDHNPDAAAATRAIAAALVDAASSRPPSPS